MFTASTVIGTGHFGKVLLARFIGVEDLTVTSKHDQKCIELTNELLPKDTLFALKVIKVEQAITAKQIDHLFSEKNCLKRI
jgi:hypothetical protein